MSGRNLSIDFRNSLEDQSSGEFGVMLLTLGYGQLAEPKRIVNDVVDYVFGGDTFYAMPYLLQLLSDDDTPPKGQITIQNAHRAIGRFISRITRPLNAMLEIYDGEDFSAPARVAGRLTRNSIGSPARQYSARYIKLRGIVGDVAQIKADLTTFDPTGEPCPARRATIERAPGLFLR